jgi:hypothetical protein
VSQSSFSSGAGWSLHRRTVSFQLHLWQDLTAAGATAGATASTRERGSYSDDGLVSHSEHLMKTLGGVSGLLEKLSESTETVQDCVLKQQWLPVEGTVVGRILHTHTVR